MPRRPRWRGWPPKHSEDRKELDDLYWGDPVRKVQEGWYFYPCLYTEATIAPIAFWKDAATDADDYETKQVYRFAAAWGHWRAAMGDDLDARLEHDALRIDRNVFEWPPLVAMLLFGQPR